MERISKDTVNAKAYVAVKQAIMSAYFKPGEILTLRSLREMLGTSDMPIREALKQLAAERAVEARANRSPRIPVLDVKRMKEIVELRVMLEGRAAGLAAEHITNVELAAVEKEQGMAEVALAKGDVPKYLRHNANFHFMIYRASRTETIISLIESLWLQFAPTFSLTFERFAAGAGQSPGADGNHHANIVRALRDRDAAAARREIERDILEPTLAEGFWDLLRSAGAVAEGEGESDMNASPPASGVDRRRRAPAV